MCSNSLSVIEPEPCWNRWSKPTRGKITGLSLLQQHSCRFRQSSSRTWTVSPAHAASLCPIAAASITTAISVDTGITCRVIQIYSVLHPVLCTKCGSVVLIIKRNLSAAFRIPNLISPRRFSPTSAKLGGCDPTPSAEHWAQWERRASPCINTRANVIWRLI